MRSVLLLIITITVGAGPIITRHDAADDTFIQFAAELPVTEAVIRYNKTDVAGTLIAPRWILSAAHVAETIQPGRTLVLNSGDSVEVAEVVLHPGWIENGRPEDIALIRLTRPVLSIRPAKLYTGRAERGQDVIVIGNGDFGTGLTGPAGNDGKMRAATNRIDGATDTYLTWTFDDPRNGEQATPLEGVSGPGDSGGPAFLKEDTDYRLAGISSGQSTQGTGGQEGLYGVTEYYTRVSTYAPWIQATISNGAPHEEGYLEGYEGADLFYRVIGTGQDTVVVVHGGPGAGIQSILPSVKPLADRYVLIFYDQRGGGRSALPTDTSKLQPTYFVEDLDAVRRHFKIPKMNVIAHSFGAVVVAQYATAYPHNLNRMVFHGATGPVRRQVAEIMRARAKSASASPDTALSRKALELLQSLLKGTAHNPVETCRAYEKISAKLARDRGERVTYQGSTCEASPEAVRYYYRYTAQLAPQYFGDWDFSRGLGQLEAPLLVVYGRDDTLSIPSQRRWASAVPNGRLLLVPDAGKAAFSANPAFVFAAVEAFFSGHWPSAAEVP